MSQAVSSQHTNIMLRNFLMCNFIFIFNYEAIDQGTFPEMLKTKTLKNAKVNVLLNQWITLYS